MRGITSYHIRGHPTGHPAPVRTVLDEDPLRFETMWAAGGNPDAVFPVAPAALASATAARATELAPPQQAEPDRSWAALSSCGSPALWASRRG